MPTELRHILFRPPEIVTAVSEFSRRTGTKLPSGAVVHTEIESVVEDGIELVRFLMVVDTEGGGPAGPRQREVRTGGAALAAALILFCRDKRIPLPSDSDKSLRRVGDQIALVVARNPKKEKMPRLEPV